MSQAPAYHSKASYAYAPRIWVLRPPSGAVIIVLFISEKCERYKFDGRVLERSGS